MRLEEAKIRKPKEKVEVNPSKNNNPRRVSLYGESYKGEYYNLLLHIDLVAKELKEN